MPKKKINVTENDRKQYTFGTGDSHSTVAVWCDGRVYDPQVEGYQPVYSDQITTKEWSYTANDIQGGLNEVPNLYAAAQSLFAFLYTCCQASDDNEDRNMFPEHIRLWGDQFTNEIATLSLEAARLVQAEVPSSTPDTDNDEDVFGIDEA